MQSWVGRVVAQRYRVESLIGIGGMGAVFKAAAVVDGEVCVRDQLYLSFSFDHRVIDGAQGGRFLNAIQTKTEALTESELGVDKL